MQPRETEKTRDRKISRVEKSEKIEKMVVSRAGFWEGQLSIFFFLSFSPFFFVCVRGLFFIVILPFVHQFVGEGVSRPAFHDIRFGLLVG